MESSGLVSWSLSSSTVSRTARLVLRVLSLMFLLIALILISVDSETAMVNVDTYVNENTYGGYTFNLNDFQSYRYMLATIIIGFAYNLFQMALLISNVVSGKRLIRGDVGYHLDFFGDKMTAYLLATGAAAGFGASGDVHRVFTRQFVLLDSFFNIANASSALLFVAFTFTAIASVLASFALPKNRELDQPLVEDNSAQ